MAPKDIMQKALKKERDQVGSSVSLTLHTTRSTGFALVTTAAVLKEIYKKMGTSVCVKFKNGLFCQETLETATLPEGKRS